MASHDGKTREEPGSIAIEDLLADAIFYARCTLRLCGVRKEFHNDCPQLLLRKENSANRGKTDEWYQRGDKRYKFRVMGFPAE